MSFLEWRRFDFFDWQSSVDHGSVDSALGNTNVTATSCGHGSLVLCDNEGLIHIINRNFKITSFQGYLKCVSLAVQLKTSPVLITIGEDDVRDNCVIKIWDLGHQDRQGNPIRLKSIKTSPTDKSLASALCVCENGNLMSVGFENGSIILYRGNIMKDRILRHKLIRDKSHPITGLAFKMTGNNTYLFVSTTDSILLFNVTSKEKETMTTLDTIGCDRRCSLIAEGVNDCPYFVARKDAIYCYAIDGRGPCYAVDGPKVCIQWFRNYLIIVAEDKATIASPVTLSSTTTSDEYSRSDSDKHVITVLDVQNKFIVYSKALQDVQDIFTEWGSFYILTSDHQIHHFPEKDLPSKLEMLFKKNLYDICIRIAKSQQCDYDSLIDIFRLYGDHLYARGDYSGAIKQFMKTIGKLEPSYVIRKFLDSQLIEQLIEYLSALHREGVATEDHTTLMLNCYTKLNDLEELKKFVFEKDREFNFDLNIAINVIRKSSSKDALLLSERHGFHHLYVEISVEDEKNYSKALEYIAKLKFSDAYELTMKFGSTFFKHIPNEFTQFMKILCTYYYPSDALLLDKNDEEQEHADPEDFIHLFMNNSPKMVEWLQYLIKRSNKWNSTIYETLIEHHLYMWSMDKEPSARAEHEQKIMSILESEDVNYDKNQALLLSSIRDFEPGILRLLEEHKLYDQILRYHLRKKNYQNVLTCCRKFGYQEPYLWKSALLSVVNDDSFPSNILDEILVVIEKENLLSPLQVIDILSRSESLTIDDIRTYLLSVLKSESKVINEEKSLIARYETETNRIRSSLKEIQNKPVVFQASFCCVCKGELELPSVHFLCQHSFHQHCFQGHTNHESECPKCLPTNVKILSVIKSQEHNIRDVHETFHSQFERSEDCFSLIADYFGRNVFSKIDSNVEYFKSVANLPKPNNKVVNDDFLLDLKFSSEETTPRKTIGKNDYGMSLDSHILPVHSSPSSASFSGKSQINASSVSDSTRIITARNKTINIEKVKSNNPFDDEAYDESKNPFANDADDGYDSSLNPFE